MKKIKAENGGYYTTYASGDGAIRFIHHDINNQATSEKVPTTIALSLVPEGYTTLYLSGELLAIHPVFRVSNNVLLRGGDNTKYIYWYEEQKGYGFIWHDSNGTPRRLENICTIAELTFFIKNEETINKQLT